MAEPCPRRVEELFDQAIDLDPARLPTFLEEQCAGDADLRGEPGAANGCIAAIAPADLHRGRRGWAEVARALAQTKGPSLRSG